MRRQLLAAALCLVLAACAAPGSPPVAERSPVFGAKPESYLVQPDDTLYSVAWRYELDVDRLVRWNRLRAPYVLRPGERLLLRPPARAQSAPQPSRQPSPAPRPEMPPPALDPDWRWPVATAPETGGRAAHAREYQLPAGSSIRAAGAGTVVYAGPGLGGYLHLVILRHSGDLLSAYSFNVAPLTAEGNTVKAGAKLADIPSAGQTARRFRFEIRRQGRPVDPGSVIDA